MNARTRECSLLTFDNNGHILSNSKTPYPAFYISFAPDNTRMMNLSNYQIFGWGYDIGLQYIDIGTNPLNTLMGFIYPFSLLIHKDHGRPYYYSWHPNGEPQLIAHVGDSRLDLLTINKDKSIETKKIYLGEALQPGFLYFSIVS